MLSYQMMLIQAASAAVETGQATAVTIGHRVSMLATLPFWPHPDNLVEAGRMVTEKFEALAEGTVAASGEMAALGMRTFLGATDAQDLASGLMSVAVAATEPAERRVRANALRLSGH